MRNTKIICIILSLLLLSGCRSMFTDLYSSNSSSNEQVYNENIDEVISQIEDEISQKEQAGEITVDRFEEVFEAEEDQENAGEAGTQNVIIGGNINSQPVEEIKPADINTTGEKPLYYNHLTDSQKQIYRYLKTAIEQMKTGFFSVGAVKEGENRFTDIAIAFRALSYDNPQFFWLPNTYRMSSDGSAVIFAQSENDYPLTIEEKTLAKIRLDTVVNNLTNQANKLSSRYEKEKFFHDWLCENVTYNDDGTNDVYTAYGALINGVAVCEGYSRAMQLLCDSVGIPCTVVCGSSRNVGHMWNVVNPGDGWYHLDVTWDDDEKFNVVRHAYFNLTDQQILEDHELFDIVQDGKYYVGGDDFNIYLYECNNKTYNYFIKNDLIFTADYASNAKIIITSDQAGHNYTEVYYDGEEYEAFLNQVNIALWQSGADVWLSDYSYLGNSLVVWW